MRTRSTFALLLACALLVTSAAAQDDHDRIDREAGGDRFSVGGTVNVTTPVTADLLVAGGNVEVDTKVGGDLLAIGGNVRIKGEIESGVFAGGGQMLLNARVKRSARIAGGQVEIGPKGELGGNLSVAGGQVRVEGPVFGYIQAAGGNVFLDGPVGGDVWVTAGRVKLGPNARIAGKLQYASQAELEQADGAMVKGGVERLDFPVPKDEHERAETSYVASFVWTVGLMLLAAVLVVVAPAFTARVSGALRGRPWFALLLGFIVLVCVPVAGVILLVTVIGIPLALIVLIAYPLLLLIGYEMTAIGISDWVLQRVSALRASSSLWRAVAAALAVLVIALLTRVPVLGGLIAFLALLVGLGGLVLQWRKPSSASA